MFTIEQIKEAHAKVKSGSDFPQFAQALKALNIRAFDYYVIDGREVYYGIDEQNLYVDAKYPNVQIESLNKQQFIEDLKRHQQGETDFPGFLKDCAKSGIGSWQVHLEDKTCTYFDIQMEKIWVEEIPI